MIWHIQRTLRHVFSSVFPETRARGLAAPSEALSFKGVCYQVHNHSSGRKGNWRGCPCGPAAMNSCKGMMRKCVEFKIPNFHKEMFPCAQRWPVSWHCRKPTERCGHPVWTDSRHSSTQHGLCLVIALRCSRPLPRFPGALPLKTSLLDLWAVPRCQSLG